MDPVDDPHGPIDPDLARLQGAVATVMDRQKVRTGEHREHLSRLAGMWNAYLSSRPPSAAVDETDVALLLALSDLTHLAMHPFDNETWVRMIARASAGAIVTADVTREADA